jgi:histidinol dehydrogenase
VSIYDFLKRTSLVRCGAGSFAALGPPTRTLATAEGLPAHAHSADLRLSKPMKSAHAAE